jgi:hypothetical protein
MLYTNHFLEITSNVFFSKHRLAEMKGNKLSFFHWFTEMQGCRQNFGNRFAEMQGNRQNFGDRFAEMQGSRQNFGDTYAVFIISILAKKRCFLIKFFVANKFQITTYLFTNFKKRIWIGRRAIFY